MGTSSKSLAPARRMSQIKHPSMAAPGGFRAAGIEPGNPEMIPMHRGELRMMAAEQKWKEEEERKKAAPVDHKHGMSFPGGYVRPEASDDIEGTMAGGDAFSAPAPDNPLPRVDWKSRWAPKQKDHIEAHRLQSAEHSTEFNIWYGKYEGDRMHQRGNERAGGRCCMATDSGKTLADTRAKAFMCLHFSRGLCAKGKNCTYHHHLPTPADEKRIGKLHDCFGRERHATDREDMCGVGNFVRESRTLYIGRIKSLPKEELEEQIYRHFSEWGDIQEYRVVEKKQIAFVRYYYRMNAEFAREAMMEQPLDDDEILNVRWAHDDPNPKAIDRNKRERIDEAIQMVEASGHCLVQSNFDYPVDYQMPPEKRVCTEGQLGAGSDMYPNTDGQFDSTMPMTREQLEAQAAAKERVKASADAQEAEAQRVLDSAQSEDRLNSILNGIPGMAESSGPLAAADTWVSHVTAEGHMYYVSATNGSSTWTVPEGDSIDPAPPIQMPGAGATENQAGDGNAFDNWQQAAKQGDGHDYGTEESKELWDQKQANAEHGGVGAWGYYSSHFQEARTVNDKTYVNYGKLQADLDTPL